MMPNKKALLVTGGSGYIGSALVKAALATGYQLHVLDTAPLPEDAVLSAALEQGDIKVFAGTIADKALVQQSLERVHYVVHLAGVSDGRAGKADPELTKRINIDTIEWLLSCSKAAGVSRFIFASTMGIYGSKYKRKLIEDLEPAPEDPYSESKAIGERFVNAADSESMQTLSLRIAMVYGAGVRIREDFLVNKMCQMAAEQGSLTVVGGRQRRPQIHVSDLAALVIKLLNADEPVVHGTSVNVVESNPSLIDIATEISKVLPNTKVEIVQSESAIDSFEMGSERLTNDLQFVPAFSLSDGIGQTIRYFQNKTSKA